MRTTCATVSLASGTTMTIKNVKSWTTASVQPADYKLEPVCKLVIVSDSGNEFSTDQRDIRSFEIEVVETPDPAPAAPAAPPETAPVA